VTLEVTSFPRMGCDHGAPPGTDHDRRITMRNSPASKPPKPLLSVEEAAVLLGETRSTLYRAIKAGTFPLPIFRIGQRIRIPRRSVERVLAGLPLTPPEDALVAVSHPSMGSMDQVSSTGAQLPAAPEDSIFPT
jgi:excisionase family DNA binding protein